MGPQWDYRTHPSFFDFACGLMALPHTPDCLRDDPELQREFPPTLATARVLAGVDGGLGWNTPEMLAEAAALEALSVRMGL